MTRLYSFGYNAFQQTSNRDNTTIIEKMMVEDNIKKVLYACWETTILQSSESSTSITRIRSKSPLFFYLTGDNKLAVWGYQPKWLAVIVEEYKDREIEKIVGELTVLLAVLDTNHTLSVFSPQIVLKDKLQGVKDVVYMKSDDSLFILDMSGAVCQYTVSSMTAEKKRELKTLPRIEKMIGSNNHVLFLTSSSLYPVYAMGYNRLSQLGMDYQIQEMADPTIIEYFCGLGVASGGSCHQFHSAVILGGEVYTFGWSKEGRLGWGDHDDDIISTALFLDKNDMPVDRNIVRVSCGSNHTIAIDGNLVSWNKWNSIYLAYIY